MKSSNFRTLELTHFPKVAPFLHALLLEFVPMSQTLTVFNPPKVQTILSCPWISCYASLLLASMVHTTPLLVISHRIDLNILE
jgi:hypothetical protein